MRQAALLFLVFTVLPLLGLAGQDSASARVGQRVRLKTNATSSSPWLVGTLVADDGDSLRLQVADHAPVVSVARRTVSQLEVSGGRYSHAGTGALVGFGIGALSGAVIGGIDASGCTSWCFFSPGAETVSRAALFGGVGALVGALVGEASQSDRWEPVSWGRTHVTLAPRGAGLAFSLAF